MLVLALSIAAQTPTSSPDAGWCAKSGYRGFGDEVGAAPRVWILSGKTSAKPWSARDGEAEDIWRFGYALASLGDVNGDGLTGLAVGTWGGKAAAPGRAFLVSGQTGTILREVRRTGDEVVVRARSSAAAPR